MSAPFHIVDGPLDDAARAALVFAGALVVHRNLAAMHALIAATKVLLAEAFAPHEALSAHTGLSPDTYRDRVAAVSKRFAANPAIDSLYRAVFAAVGVDPAATYGDRLRLRILPPDASYWDRRIRPLQAHRDTWGSNVMQQINWWAPVYPVAADRTMALYPRYWDKPIANTSAGWDFEALKTRGKPYPRLPVASEAVDPADAAPVLIEPGDILCFSGAHLHASVASETGSARISTDMRTVSPADIREGRGAPNIDGAAPRTQHDWFHHMEAGVSLSEAL